MYLSFGLQILHHLWENLNVWWSSPLCKPPPIGLSPCCSKNLGKKLNLLKTYEIPPLNLITQILTQAWNSWLHAFIPPKIRILRHWECYGCCRSGSLSQIDRIMTSWSAILAQRVPTRRGELNRRQLLHDVNSSVQSNPILVSWS
jgi:hypothetical protein